jgi:hypothetical protein
MAADERAARIGMNEAVSVVQKHAGVAAALAERTDPRT